MYVVRAHETKKKDLEKVEEEPEYRLITIRSGLHLLPCTLENASTPRGGTKKYPPYPLVPPAKFSALTLVPPNPRVLKTGTKNRY